MLRGARSRNSGRDHIAWVWMLTWLPASVGARSLRCCAIRSPGIRRQPATTRCHVSVDSRQSADDRTRNRTI